MGLPEGWQEAANTGMTLALWADDRGDANALTGPHGTRTFTELNAEANQLVRLLRRPRARGGRRRGAAVRQPARVRRAPTPRPTGAASASPR